MASFFRADQAETIDEVERFLHFREFGRHRLTVSSEVDEGDSFVTTHVSGTACDEFKVPETFQPLSFPIPLAIASQKFAKVFPTCEG